MHETGKRKQRHLTAALARHQIVLDVLEEINDKEKLGELYVRQDRLQKAEIFSLQHLPFIRQHMMFLKKSFTARAWCG